MQAKTDIVPCKLQPPPGQFDAIPPNAFHIDGAVLARQQPTIENHDSQANAVYFPAPIISFGCLEKPVIVCVFNAEPGPEKHSQNSDDEKAGGNNPLEQFEDAHADCCITSCIVRAKRPSLLRQSLLDKTASLVLALFRAEMPKLRQARPR